RLQQVLENRGGNLLEPVRSARIAIAATFAWLLAEKPDFGISPAMQASPMTWMFPSALLCIVAGSIAQYPLSLVRPAVSAIRPAFCAGMMLATSALIVSRPVTISPA